MSDESLPENGGSRGRWARLASGVPKAGHAAWTSLRAMSRSVLEFFGVAAAVLLAFFVVRAVTTSPLVIEAFSTPKQLQDSGYSGAVVARHILDEVRAIYRDSNAFHVSQRDAVVGAKIDGDDGQALLATIQVPSTGLTLKGVVSALRELLGRDDNKISGDITVGPPSGFAEFQGYYSMLLLIEGPDGKHRQSLQSASLAELFKLAAREIVGHFDPQSLVAYLNPNDGDELVVRSAVINKMLRGPSADRIKWGLVFVGNSALEESERPYERAIPYYQQATRVDPNFGVAYYLWGWSLEGLNRPDEAMEKYSQAIKASPQLLGPYHNRGLLLADRNEYRRAFADLTKAMELGLSSDRVPSYELARMYVSLGNMLRDLDQDSSDHKECYRRAAAHDPGQVTSVEGGDYEPSQYNRRTGRAPHLPLAGRLCLGLPAK